MMTRLYPVALLLTITGPADASEDLDVTMRMVDENENITDSVTREIRLPELPGLRRGDNRSRAQDAPGRQLKEQARERGRLASRFPNRPASPDRAVRKRLHRAVPLSAPVVTGLNVLPSLQSHSGKAVVTSGFSQLPPLLTDSGVIFALYLPACVCFLVAGCSGQSHGGWSASDGRGCRAFPVG